MKTILNILLCLLLIYIGCFIIHLTIGLKPAQWWTIPTLMILIVSFIFAPVITIVVILLKYFNL